MDFIFFYLVMEDHVIDACDYITWGNIIDLEESRKV